MARGQIIFGLKQAAILTANLDSEHATEQRPGLQVNMAETKVTESKLNILPNSTNAFYKNSKVDASKAKT